MNLLKKILLFFSARKFIEIINSGFGWQSAEQDTQGFLPIPFALCTFICIFVGENNIIRCTR